MLFRSDLDAVRSTYKNGMLKVVLPKRRQNIKTTLIRMFEYGSQIALDAGKVENGVLTVRFPNAAVLYLRCRVSTPDLMTIRIELPGGEGNVSEYTIPIMKAQRYSPEEIFAKGLLFLIPFRIFSHEERFAEYEKDKNSLETLTAEYSLDRKSVV